MNKALKVWYLVRKPIGILLFTLAFWLILGVIHGLPYLLTDLLGI